MRPLLLTILLSPSLALGQQRTAPRITFDFIGVNEGLPHAQTDCFLEDKRGSLWVGGQQGLSVYDGTNFIPVQLQNDGEPIGVRAMAEDDEGIIWIGAEQGPVRLDPLSRKAELLDIPDSLRFGVQTLWVHSVAVTKPGEVLFGANQTTFFLDTRTGTFRGLHGRTGEVAKTFWKFMLADSARQGIWITTHQWGLVFYHTPSGKLYEKDGDRSISPLIGEPVISLCPDGSGGFWCSHRRSGNICHWDGRSQQFRQWDHVPGDARSKVSSAWFLGRDSQGRIWGSASRPGGFMFDPRDSTAVAFNSDNGSAGALPQGSINVLYESGNGEIWFGNVLGIAIHDPTRPQPQLLEVMAREQSPDPPRIWAMEFSGDSVLWCAMGEFGLVRMDLLAHKVQNVPLDRADLEQPFVWDVLTIPDGVLIACESGVLLLDPKTLRCKKITVVDQHGLDLEQGRKWLASNMDGSVWMGCGLAKVVRLEPTTGKAFVHVTDSTQHGSLRYDNVYDAVSMKDGRTWMGGNLTGLTYCDARTNEWVDLQADVKEGRMHVGRIISLAASSDSVLWLASDGAGLIRYDITTGKYTHYGQRHGITELGLFSVVVDGRGRIWTNSDERVFCFDPMKEHAMVVGARSSTGGDAAKFVLCMSSSGMIAMNIGREVVVFDANAVGSDRVPPAPVLTRLLVDGTAMDIGADGAISMRYDNAQLEVHFGAMLPPGTISRFAMRAPGEQWSEYTEGRVTLRGLQPGEHEFEFRLMSKEGAWGKPTTLHVYIAPPWWQTLWARVLFGLFLAGTIVLVFRARLNWIRKRERAQEEQVRQVNALKLQALRAQMDPHFIFNCLNSIDGYIVSNEQQRASHYLGRFAKLIRLILQYSDSSAIPLEKEVEMLKHYLELEAQRFKTPFAFEVVMDEELMDEAVEIPTMLVQPFVENAIWHGLQHKKEQGRLRVRFSLKEDELVCTVEDDGVGRAASRIINEGREKTHKSMGMRVSSDRLNLLKQHGRQAARVDIEDLQDPTGTRVTIHIPLHSSEHTEE